MRSARTRGQPIEDGKGIAAKGGARAMYGGREIAAGGHRAGGAPRRRIAEGSGKIGRSPGVLATSNAVS